MDPLTIKLKTLTPLWTGGVDQSCDRLHETGLIGSLRWWYEALVRGLGGYACDPTEHSCQFNEEKYRKSQAANERQRLRDAGLCDACQLFGATGWARKFRLRVIEDSTQPIRNDTTPLNICPPDRTRGWFLPIGKMGKFILRMEGEAESVMAYLFLFLEKKGSLGAKPQLGYGLFEIENRTEVHEVATHWRWVGMGENLANTLPNLRQFTFFRYSFKPASPTWWTKVPGMERVATKVQLLVNNWGLVPVVPALKNEWRFHQWQKSWGDRQRFFGSIQPERRRGQLGVSWAYRKGEEWEIRGWAWLAGLKEPQKVKAMLSNDKLWNEVIGQAGVLEVLPSQLSEYSPGEIRQLLNGEG